MAAETSRGACRGLPPTGAGRSAHLPVDDALAPFADMLRQHLPTPEEIEQAAARRQQLRKGRGLRAGAAAAVAALALVLVVWLDPVLQRQTLATAVGERQDWRLADGSRVQLNTGSRVQVSRHLRSRRLVLAQGEASFEVAHAPWHGWAPWLQRPFTVQAADILVEDIGTVFNVRQGADGTDVAVLQGAVRVHALQPGVPPVELRGGQRLRSRAGQPLPATGIQDSAAGDALAWRQGRLVFDGTPLAEALADMQRYRTAPIVLADRHAAQLRISGQFDLDRIDQLLDLLPRLAPVQVRHEDGGRVVVTARHR